MCCRKAAPLPNLHFYIPQNKHNEQVRTAHARYEDVCGNSGIFNLVIAKDGN